MGAHRFLDGIVVSTQHADDRFGVGARRECGEAAQVAEHHDDLDAPPVENAVVADPVDQFSHLRREESLEAADAFRAFL